LRRQTRGRISPHSMTRFLSPCWKQFAILLLLISAAATLSVSAQDHQEDVRPPGSADPDQHPAPDTGSRPGVTICDPGTFANCHKVQGVVPPKLTHSRDPEYPVVARQLHIDGFSIIQLVVDEQGVPRSLIILKSATDRLPADQRDAGEKFDASALKAVKDFRFRPATLAGKPVPAQIKVEEKFHTY
jgi:TonB family protein